LRIQSEEGLNASIKKIQGSIAVLEDYKPPRQPEISQKLTEARTKERRRKTVRFEGNDWLVEAILNYDKDETEWLKVSEIGKRKKEIQIQISMTMGFTAQYFGDQPDEIEGMLLLASYIALAEVVARNRGDKNMQNINNTPTTNGTIPVRPPSFTPAPDST